MNTRKQKGFSENNSRLTQSRRAEEEFEVLSETEIAEVKELTRQERRRTAPPSKPAKKKNSVSHKKIAPAPEIEMKEAAAPRRDSKPQPPLEEEDDNFELVDRSISLFQKYPPPLPYNSLERSAPANLSGQEGSNEGLDGPFERNSRKKAQLKHFWDFLKPNNYHVSSKVCRFLFGSFDVVLLLFIGGF